MKIFKYEIPIEEKFYLELPSHSKILSFQIQNEKPYIWVLLDENKILKHRYFNIVGTGNDFEFYPNTMIYIGTIQIEPMVWHLFENLIWV